MTIYINEEDKKLFEQNGFNQESVGNTVNHYRDMGLSDDEIQGKINQRLEGWRTPVPRQPVKTEYTYPKQDLSSIENNPAAQREFIKNVDNIYNVPQVPMPNRGEGYTNSDGEFREKQPTFAENHPIINSIPQAGKQLLQGAVHSYPNFAKGLNDAIALAADKTKALNIAPVNNPLYNTVINKVPLLNVGDAFIRNAGPISNSAKQNAEFWENAARKVERPKQYQGFEGLKNKETFIPTLAGEIGEQATNLLMAMGGGSAAGMASKAQGLGKLGTGVATFAGTSIPNLAQEGQYLEKIEQFKNINGRMPNAEELKQIQNVAMGEKAINTALESVADRLLFGKLFPEGAASKGLKNIAKSAGQQALTEGLTETAQEGTSVGAEKLLGLNQDDWKENLARLGEAGLLGGLTGGIIGGGTTAISQPYDTQFKKSEPAEIEKIAPKTSENIKNKASKPVKQPKVDKKIEEIAPKTTQSIQENNSDAMTGKVENQYTDDAKIVYDGNKYEALTPEELENIKAPEETNPNIKIDEDSAEALKGHIKNNDIVIDQNNEEVLSGHIKTPEEKKIEKIAPNTIKKTKEKKAAADISGENIRVGLDENGDLQHYDISDSANIKKVGEPIYNESTHINKELAKNQDLVKKIAAEGFDENETNDLIRKMENTEDIGINNLLHTIQAKLYKKREKSGDTTFNELEALYKQYRAAKKQKIAEQKTQENIEQVAPKTAEKIKKSKITQTLVGGVEKSENITYNDNKEGQNEQQQSDERTTGQNRQMGETVEGSEVDRGTDVDSGRGDNIGLESKRGQRISPKDKEIVEKEYKNQHELNQAIENYINTEEYRKYNGSVRMPQEVKNWLKKYAGAGGLEKQGAEGKGLLSEYYTPQNVVNKMWDLTKQYVETDGAKVLEPSAGIGRFLENAPENTKFDAVEMNPVSAKITKILYPDANVTTGEFQERFIDKEKNLPVKKVNGEYDIVIGNPPYGQYSGRYKGLGEGAKYEQLESYFINRSLDSLKDNGILTFIVPSSFLKGQRGKLEIAGKCELLDAYRLPNNTFDTTSIGTDIIVMRKKSNGISENNLFGDNWFKKHPEKILGEVEKGKGNWGSDIVKGDKNAVEKIDTSKTDKKTTQEIVVKNSAPGKTVAQKKRTTKEKPILKGNVEYTEYKHENPVSEEDLKYFIDTQVDGTLPKSKYSPNEKVNQFNGDLYNDFNYLQGDIYEKLDALESENISDSQKELQRKKLMKVLPKPKELRDINLTPTSDFAREYPVKGMVYDYNTNSNVEGNTYLDKKYLDWVGKLTNSEREGVSAWDIDSFVRGEKIRIRYRGNPSKEEKDNQRAEYMTKLKNAVDKTFNDFLNSELSEKERKELTDKWNRKFNKLYTPDYKIMPMIVKGLNSKFYGKDLKLQDVQVEGINYLTNKGVGLLGFEVGVGKTLAGTIATVQNMQMGRCKKPLILVPKQVKPNWIREIHEAFPNIKINDLDNLSNFSGEIEDGSISVATFQALDNLWYSPETLKNLQWDVYKTGNNFNKESQSKRESTKRGQEKTKERFEEFIGKAEKGNKKKRTFEELGIDHITVDEAHNFKNLFADAKADGQEGNTYSKITGAESTRAKRMFLATQYILGNNNNRNVFMLTATPFNNSPLEVFNMLSYMAKDKLDNMGLYNVYQFMENYVDLTADWVVDSKNDVIYKQIAKGFKNLESLQSIIDSCMLIRSAEDAGIKRPNKHTKKVILEPTQEQLKLMAEAESEAVGIHKNEEGEISIDENSRNNGAVLKAISKARMATLSPDIYKGNTEVSPENFVKNSPKLNYVASAVEAMLKKDNTTSQIIYMPLGVDFLPKLKQYFVDKKVLKADEIAIIKSGVDDDKINEITDSFNDVNGKIKLIIGTNKIKEGMNLNKNSSVLYVPYMDWNPTDYMQIVGRIWRRGNKYNDIRVVVPLLKDSSDPFMFQKLNEKTSRINNIMDRGKNYIDTGELDAVEEKINMIANPDKKASMFSQIERQKLNSEKEKLEGQLQTTRYYLRELKDAEDTIKSSEERIATLKEEQKEIEDKESWSYKYNQENIERHRKTLNNAKIELKLLNARIKRFELDFNGKDSEENINKKLDEIEEKIKQLKDTTEKMRAKYKDEYEKNRNTSKTIEEHIKEFNADTDSLYKNKNVELYSKNYNPIVKREHTIAHLTDNVQIEQSTNAFIGKVKDIIESSPEMQYLRGLARNIEDVEVRLFSQDEINELGNFAGAKFDGYNILVMPNAPIWKVAHEMKHARDLIKNLKSPIGLLSTTNGIIGNILYKNLNGTKLEWLGEWWYNAAKVEKDAYAVENKVKEHYGYSGKISGQNTQNLGRGNRGVGKNRQTGFKIGFFSKAENGKNVSEYAQKSTSGNRSPVMEENINGQNKTGSTTGARRKEINKNTGDEINQVVRDKVYNWHGNLESDRYDVDKTLNSFINLTKHKAKDFSKKLGVKVSDKQIREIMPFLRERTDLPENLNRPELTKLYNALSDSQKESLRKLADSVSDKFEKYYTNYKDAKGEQTTESIENHISHIWDLDNKKKSLMTNYITTKSKFAKQRTIGTLVEGIDGIEINGEKVQFKPKTLDYAEILKESSDNLIKSTHDSILANEIKNLKYKGKPLVLAAAKAPDEWVEVNHPALNKAVYLGEVGERELPLLMKTPVKVHPEIADYVSSIFEVQKNSKFWDTFDSLNGMIKQTLLGFSGFHGYALSESSIGNAGVKKTLSELNPKKFIDAIKNGNYDVYKNEEAAKRAINAGVQLGTPSDLQRNLVEDALKKIPLVGKAISGTVSANNKILWDVLHNNFKVLAFNTAVENLGGNVTKEQERAIAQWVNDSFGGQAWELLGIKKSAIKAASRVLLSPDWNFSTIRQAAAAINSEWADNLLNNSKLGKRIGKLTGISEENGSNGVRGKIGRGFWLRSAIFFTVFYNLINAAFREKDRKEHPDLYPDEMTPMDYSIWSNSYPMDGIYDRIMPKVFIGRNSDGTARMLRVGKQFREVPEFLTEPISKLGGKTSPIINIASQVGVGMSPSDVVKRALGGDAYLNQDVWDGYGENAKMRTGSEAITGRAKALGKSLVPYIGSKYIGGKHEFSMWDFFAQTSAGGSKSKVFKQTKEALKAGKPELIDDIKRRAYQDGIAYSDIQKMVKYANKDYKAENTRNYKKKLADSFATGNEREYEKIRKKMTKKHISEDEQRRIRNKAYEEYLQNNKN